MYSFQISMHRKDTSAIPDKVTFPYPSIPDIEVALDGERSLPLISDCIGLDNIHVAFLKHTAFETAPLLTHLFQQLE